MVRMLALGLALLAASGCSGESSGAAPAPRVAPLLQGSVREAPGETTVHLVGPVAGAPTLPALCEAVIDSVDAAPDGSFALERLAPGPHRVLVSAPGKALRWVAVPDDVASLGSAIELAPEARLELVLRDPAGGPEEMAVALLLDPAGSPLPLAVGESVTDEAGRLSAGRIPEGAFELVVVSLDLTRVGRAPLRMRAGGTTSLELVLDEDPVLLGRALRLVGLDELAAIANGEEVVR